MMKGDKTSKMKYILLIYYGNQRKTYYYKTTPHQQLWYEIKQYHLYRRPIRTGRRIDELNKETSKL